MLDFMRSQAQGWIVKVLFAVIVLSFALWGVGDYFSGQSSVTVAKVGEQTIKQRAFQRRFQQQRNRIEQQLGAEMGGRITERPQFRQRILSQMVQRRLIDQEVARLGLTASDRAVAQQVQQRPAFQRGGEFSTEAYRSVLSRIGQTPAKFEASVRGDLAASQLRQFVREAGVVADPEVARAYRVRNEERALRYAAVSPAGFREQVSVDEKALKAFYEEHADRYRRPARARIRWVELSPDTYQAARPSEEELRDYYRQHRSEFAETEERKARHILLKVGQDAPEGEVAEARQRARELAEQARDGASFAELARQHSQGPSASAGGDLGWFKQGDMVGPFAERAFQMEPGQISDPVRTRFGFHVIRLEDVRGGKAPDFSQVREQVAEQWRQEQGANRLFERLPTFKDLLYTRDSLEPAAEEFGLEIRGPAWVPAKGQLPEAVPASDQLRKTALNTQPGRNSDAVELDSTRFVGVHVEKQQPAQTRPFQAVRDQVESDYRRQQARQQAREVAEAVVKSARAGSLSAAAEQHGLSVQQMGPLTLDAARRQLPGGLAETVFAAQSGKPVAANMPDGGRAVAVVDNVRQPDPSGMSDSERRDLAQELRKKRGGARMEGYLDQLRQRFPVRIRKDVVGGSAGT